MTSHSIEEPTPVPSIDVDARRRYTSPRHVLKERLVHAVHAVVGPFAKPLMAPQRFRHLWLLPSLPRFVRARYLPPTEAWRDAPLQPPEELRTQPGIGREPGLEQQAFQARAVPEFAHVHFRSILWLISEQWRSLLPVAPRMLRSLRAVARVNATHPAGARPAADGAALTGQLKEYGAAIGLSAVGVAPYDEKYIFESFQGQNVGDRVVVLILEQPWKLTQQIPSAAAEQGAVSTYVELIERAVKVAEFLKERGYRAQAHDIQGRGLVIHFAVEAGLGQLGLNGQLLTPHAGSRCRISLIDTDAPLEFDAPVDYGVEKICDECRVCVRRCPPGAITSRRKFHRGVMKAKIDTARCFPVIAQTEGCAVCMKVCPVQRYGLNAVVDEWSRSGRILGKDTDELEGYYWYPDGKYYGAGERPKLSDEFLNPYPPGAELDLTRTVPLDDDRGLFGA